MARVNELLRGHAGPKMLGRRKKKKIMDFVLDWIPHGPFKQAYLFVPD